MKKSRRQSRQARQGENADLLQAAPTFLPGTVSWIRYLARIQDETFYFLHACSNRAAETIERFASCRKYEDVADAQAAFVGNWLSDFAEEGALLMSLFCELAVRANEPGTASSTG